jgi:hypothetical protein
VDACNNTRNFEDATEKLIAHQNNYEEALKNSKVLNVEVRKTEKKLEIVKANELENSKKLNALQRIINQLKREKENLEIAIQTQELEERVDELYTKQTGFWEALEGQIKAKQEEASEYMAGLGKSLPPEIIIERMQSSIIGNMFNQEAVDIRGIKYQYEETIRNLCSKKLDGSYVSSLELQKPKYLLDNFLFKPHIERIWNIQ